MVGSFYAVTFNQGLQALTLTGNGAGITGGSLSFASVTPTWTQVLSGAGIRAAIRAGLLASYTLAQNALLQSRPHALFGDAYQDDGTGTLAWKGGGIASAM
jgi:hypothetical protein